VIGEATIDVPPVTLPPRVAPPLRGCTLPPVPGSH
jgi:hypothetical protein